jgi:hypothetical protein
MVHCLDGHELGSPARMGQVNFSDAFIQAELKDVYVELPEMFCNKQNHGNKDGVMLKLNKLLYGLVQAPLSWYNHLQKGLNELTLRSGSSTPECIMGKA